MIVSYGVHATARNHKNGLIASRLRFVRYRLRETKALSVCGKSIFDINSRKISGEILSWLQEKGVYPDVIRQCLIFE